MSDHPPRYDERFTDKGRPFWAVLAAMWQWGSDGLWDADGLPVTLWSRETRQEVRPRVIDETIGGPIDARRLRVGRSRRAAEPA